MSSCSDRQLSTREKVEILHGLCDWRLDVDDVSEHLKVGLAVTTFGHDCIYSLWSAFDFCYFTLDEPRRFYSSREDVSDWTEFRSSHITAFALLPTFIIIQYCYNLDSDWLKIYRQFSMSGHLQDIKNCL